MGKVRGESLDSLKFTNLILYSMFVSIYLSSIIFHSSQVKRIENRWQIKKSQTLQPPRSRFISSKSQACSNKFGVQKHTLVSRNRERNELSDVYKQCVLMNMIPHLISSTQSARTPERVSKPAQIAPTYGQGCGIGPDYKYCKNLPFTSAAADLQLRRTPQIVRYWLGT